MKKAREDYEQGRPPPDDDLLDFFNLEKPFPTLPNPFQVRPYPYGRLKMIIIASSRCLGKIVHSNFF